MKNQVIPNGSKVSTEYGVFEVLDYCIAIEKYFCYKKGFDGHSGTTYLGQKYQNTKYDGSCWWFGRDEVTLIEESKVNDAKLNYREMKPTDMIKVCIGDNEFEVPLGDLVHTTALLAVTEGIYGCDLWDALTESLGIDGFVEDCETLFEFLDKSNEAIDYFFQPSYDKQKQKEELSNLIISKQEELCQLIDKLNQM